MLLMRFIMISTLYGFTTKSFAPSLRQAISSSTASLAVATMTGTAAKRSSAPLRRRNSKPSHSGM